MSNTLHLMVALAVGLLLGLMYFGALWWTVRKGMASPHSALWFMGSLVLRTSITLAGFFLVSAGQWDRLLACLGGFIIARLVVTRVTGRRMTCCAPLLQEAHHAPEP